ncbi:unnamed protein product [Prorocentrum cordatum]|uniref:Uncharacterized protein n=1 Tax=Prorocentrum cordatum TaxID=2364126 RepID=A0ABN9V2A9_9DINO|nr:unnamed protein product [Polarella glacialis]
MQAAKTKAELHAKACARPLHEELPEASKQSAPEASANSRRTAPALGVGSSEVVGFNGLLPGALHLPPTCSSPRRSEASSGGSRSQRASSCADSVDSPTHSKATRTFELLEAWDNCEIDAGPSKSTRSFNKDISIHTRLHANAIAGMYSSQDDSNLSPASPRAHPGMFFELRPGRFDESLQSLA